MHSVAISWDICKLPVQQQSTSGYAKDCTELKTLL